MEKMMKLGRLHEFYSTRSMFYKRQSIRDIVSFLEKLRDRLDWVPKH